MNYDIKQGDCLECMKDMEANGFDAVFCDPPYGLGKTPDVAEIMRHWVNGDDVDVKGGGFMGKSWDSFVPNPSVWREAYRVLKPGGYLFAFGGTRTVDLLAVSIRFAGFEKFDEIEWVYGSGFPKSLDISKAIDKQACREQLEAELGRKPTKGEYKKAWEGFRKVIKKNPNFRPNKQNHNNMIMSPMVKGEAEVISAAATPEAELWEGYGTALKPAHEVILCFRKPCEGTYAENCLKWGTGGINVDISRVEHNEPEKLTNRTPRTEENVFSDDSCGFKKETNHIASASQLGRFPANLIHDNSEEVRECFPESKSSDTVRVNKANTQFGFGNSNGHRISQGHNDSGNASRFFKSIIYTAKASKSERNAGCEDKNNHPCCKPLALNEYLCKMLLPPERETPRQILIPYSGSGSEMIGAMQAGWDEVIGIELDPDYCEIARARMDYWIAEKRKELF